MNADGRGRRRAGESSPAARPSASRPRLRCPRVGRDRREPRLIAFRRAPLVPGWPGRACSTRLERHVGGRGPGVALLLVVGAGFHAAARSGLQRRGPAWSSVWVAVGRDDSITPLRGRPRGSRREGPRRSTHGSRRPSNYRIERACVPASRRSGTSRPGSFGGCARGEALHDAARGADLAPRTALIVEALSQPITRPWRSSSRSLGSGAPGKWEAVALCSLPSAFPRAAEQSRSGLLKAARREPRIRRRSELVYLTCSDGDAKRGEQSSEVASVAPAAGAPDRDPRFLSTRAREGSVVVAPRGWASAAVRAGRGLHHARPFPTTARPERTPAALLGTPRPSCSTPAPAPAASAYFGRWAAQPTDDLRKFLARWLEETPPFPRQTATVGKQVGLTATRPAGRWKAPSARGEGAVARPLHSPAGGDPCTPRRLARSLPDPQRDPGVRAASTTSPCSRALLRGRGEWCLFGRWGP